MKTEDKIEQEKQLTAVEWLIDKVEDHFCLLPVDLIEQAKQMHKEQIIDAHGIKNRSAFTPSGSFYVDEIDGEQYYNETYGQTR